MKNLTAAAAVSLLICSLSAGEWHGFRGVEQDGRHDWAAAPLEWSSSQNVVWKTDIPGRGHSSPIVSEDAVYLTTTYEADHFSQSMWNYTIITLALLFMMTCISFAMQNLRGGQRYMGTVLQHIRFLLFAQILVVVIIVALFGHHLLDFDDSDVRPWLTSIVLMLCCLVLSSLFVPLRSRQQLIAGLLSLMFTAPVLIALKRKGLVLNLNSMEGLVTALALVSPMVFGLALLAAHFLSRRRQSEIIRNRTNAERDGSALWRFAATGSAGFVTGLTPFVLLIYRAAGYRMPDSFVWDNRVKPNAGWWCVGLYVLAAFAAIAVGYWKSVRGDGTWRLPMKKVFFALAIALGATFFIQANFVEKPKESIRALLCLDRGSGEILWVCEGLTGSTRGRSRTVTHASATPVTDGERVFGYFGEDGLMCVSPEGKLLWKKPEPMFDSKYGVATSPVVKDNVLIIVSDVRESAELGSSITAFDCVTGRRLWKRERKSHEEFAAYGTPVIRSLNGEQVIIVHGWHDIKAYRLETGEELWLYPIAHEGQHLVASLTSDDERLYVTGMKQVRALHLSRLGTGGDPLLWSRSIVGEKSSTPVVAGGLMFLVAENGMAFCLESQTGEVLWKKRLRGRYYSSVAVTANQVLFTNESGQTTVVAKDREFRELATNSLDESVYASVAPAGDRLFVRTIKNLYCLQQGKL